MVSSYIKPYGAAGNNALNVVYSANKEIVVARASYNELNGRYQGGINYLYIVKTPAVGAGAYTVYTRFWTEPFGRHDHQTWPELTDLSTLTNPVTYPYEIAFCQASIAAGDDSSAAVGSYICMQKPDPTKNSVVFFTGTAAGLAYLPTSFSIHVEIHFKKFARRV